MSDANKIQIIVGEEVASTYATAGTGTYVEVAATGHSLSATTGTQSSDRINTNRMTTFISRTDIGAAGDITSELSYGDHEKLYEYVLQSPDAPSAPATVTNVATTSPATVTDAGGWSGYAIGEWIRLSGFTGGDILNNNIFKITNIAGNDVTVEGPVLTTVGAAAQQEAQGSQVIKNGAAVADFHSLTIEVDHTDLTSPAVITQFLGMLATGFSIDGSRPGIFTNSFSYIGADMATQTTTSSTGITASPENPPMNAVGNVLGIRLDGLDIAATAASVQVANALRTRAVMGTLRAIGKGNGSITAGGSWTQFFTSIDELTPYLAFTDVAVAYVWQDEDGNAIVIEVPAAKLTVHGAPATGKDTDIFQEMSWESRKDPTETDVQVRMAFMTGPIGT